VIDTLSKRTDGMSGMPVTAIHSDLSLLLDPFSGSDELFVSLTSSACCISQRLRCVLGELFVHTFRPESLLASG
jgi:hypothetical protein